MNVDLTDEMATTIPFDRTDDPDTADGRRARRDRNQASVVEALLELFAEGQLHPTAQQLAQRSGVSLRSVFRYFDDMQDLTLRALEVQLARVAPLYELAPRPDGASLAERIATVAAHRARLYYAVAPVVRGASLRFHRSPELAERAERQRELVRAQVAHYFAPELDRLHGDERTILLGCLEAAAQFETGEHLTGRVGLEPDQLEAAFRLSMTRLLAPFA